MRHDGQAPLPDQLKTYLFKQSWIFEICLTLIWRKINTFFFRLSTDGSGLKGFNRADKGSQNNLVDFSVSAEKLDNSSANEEDSSENELETVFDMTAEGDSLKRRRKKKTLPDSRSNSPIVIYPDSPVPPESAKVTLEVSVDTKAESQPTNPFWRHSPICDTGSLTSCESNPFERVQFQTASSAATPSLTIVPKQQTSHIPTLPPPPKSSKPRSLSGSISRPRRHNPPSSSVAPVDSSGLTASPLTNVTVSSLGPAGDVTENSRPASEPSSVQYARLSTSNGTVSKPDSVSLLGAGEQFRGQREEFVTKEEEETGDAKVSDSGTGSSRNDPNILETTLQILDVYSQPPPPVSIEPTNISAGPAITTFSDLSQTSLSAIEHEKSAESLDGGTESVVKLKKNHLIPSKDQWEMVMRLPREKRVMSSRKWVNVFVRLKHEKVSQIFFVLL